MSNDILSEYKGKSFFLFLQIITDVLSTFNDKEIQMSL